MKTFHTQIKCFSFSINTNIIKNTQRCKINISKKYKQYFNINIIIEEKQKNKTKTNRRIERNINENIINYRNTKKEQKQTNI